MKNPKIRFKNDNGDSYNDWNKVVLGEHFSFSNGINGDRSVFTDGNTKCISVSDVVDGEPILSESIKGTANISDNLNSKYIGKHGDLFFQRSSETQEDIGHVAVYIGDEDVTYNGFIICGKPIDISYNAYTMNYALRTNSVRTQTVKLGAGAQHYNIGQESLGKIECYLPSSLDEQKKIADFIHEIDSLIRVSETEIEHYLIQKKGIVQKLLSGKVRFTTSDGNQFPKWNSVKLKKILVEYKEMCENDGTYEHVSLTKEGVVPKSERYERDFLVTSDSKKYRVTHVDDICYNPANLKFGVICRNKYSDAIFSPIYVTFKVQEGYLPQYIEMLVTDNNFINKALAYQEGTVYERMAVNPEDLLEMIVEVPTIDEQVLIAEFLNEYERLIQSSKEELECYKLIKKSIIQKMFI